MGLRHYRDVSHIHHVAQAQRECGKKALFTFFCVLDSWYVLYSYARSGYMLRVAT